MVDEVWTKVKQIYGGVSKILSPDSNGKRNMEDYLATTIRIRKKSHFEQIKHANNKYPREDMDDIMFSKFSLYKK